MDVTPPAAIRSGVLTELVPREVDISLCQEKRTSEEVLPHMMICRSQFHLVDFGKGKPTAWDSAKFLEVQTYL